MYKIRKEKKFNEKIFGKVNQEIYISYIRESSQSGVEEMLFYKLFSK